MNRFDKVAVPFFSIGLNWLVICFGIAGGSKARSLLEPVIGLREGYTTPVIGMCMVALAAVIGGINIIQIVSRGEDGIRESDLLLLQTLFSSALYAVLSGIIWFGLVSRLELAFQFGLSAAFGFLLLYLPDRQHTDIYASLLQDIRRLWTNRHLVSLWTGNNIRARYAQPTLGIAWIVLEPLAMSLVLAFVFTQLLSLRLPEGIPFISYYLTAFIVWDVFNRGIMNGMYSVMGYLALINQVYFPRETLPLSKIGEALVDTLFVFAITILINALVGVYPSFHYLLLIPLLIIELPLVIGLALFLSYLSVLVRDVPHLIIVMMQLLFFLAPIVYPVSVVPVDYQWVLEINPLVPVISAFRDVMLFNTMPDLASLLYPFTLGLLILYAGYAFFKSNEERLADYQ